MGLVTTTRRYLFQAVHQLPGIEGPHGHHFYLELTFKDAPVAQADLCFSETLQPQLEGRDLSELLTPPTGEMLVQWIHKQVLLSPFGRYVVGVSIQETPKNRFISSMTGAQFV